MAGSNPERIWWRAVLLRTGLAGMAISVVALSGGSLVLGQTGAGLREVTVLAVTTLVALGIGIWAGAPDVERDQLRARERWLSAAALVAVGGSFATFGALYQQLFPGGWWRVAGLILMLAVPSYAVGLLLPALYAAVERWLEALETEEAGGSSLSPFVGGLIGGQVFGALLAGLLLIPRLGAGSALMIMALALLVPLVLRDPTPAGPRETLLYETTSPFGHLRITEVAFPGERQPETRLYLNEEEESGELSRSGAPTLAYVAAAESWLSRITPSGASYLFLGGGAYTLPRRIAERDPEATIAVVELDPEVTRLAYRYFGLAQHHAITSVHGDARAYLEQRDRATYDRIYVDVYGGAESLPYSLVTREGAAALAGRLRDEGVVALNLIGAVVGPESRRVWSVVRTYAEVFPSLAVYSHLGRDYPERQNLLVAGSLEVDHEFPPAAGHFAAWPREEWPGWEGTTIFRDLFPQPRSPRPSSRLEPETSVGSQERRG